MGCLRRLLTKCCRRGRQAWAWAEGRRLRTPRQEVPWADRGESIRRRRGADDHAHSQAPASRVQAPRGPSRPRSLVISHLVSKVTLDTVVTQVGHESKRMATPDRLVHGGSPPGAQLRKALCSHVRATCSAFTSVLLRVTPTDGFRSSLASCCTDASTALISRAECT